MATSWLKRVTLLDGSPEDHQLTCYDALAASSTPDGKYLITSPNMEFIPAPAWGHLSVTMKSDGRFGLEDPILWPQIHVYDSKWDLLACVPRLAHPRRRPDLWRRPTISEFDPAASGAPGFYTLKQVICQKLRAHVEEIKADVEAMEKVKGSSVHLRLLKLNMHSTLSCLLVPSTEREIVRQLAALERFCCLLIAWLTWIRLMSHVDTTGAPSPVQRDLMGCFTTSAKMVAELYQAGIPVWYMRLMETINPDIRVLYLPPLHLAEWIVTDTETFGSRPIYQGYPGQGQIEAILYYGNRSVDTELVPFPADYGGSSAAHNTARTSAGLFGQPASSSSQAGPSRTVTSSISKKDNQKTRLKYAKPNVPASAPKADPNVAQKFDDPIHPCLPLLLPGWLSALRDGRHHLKPSVKGWALWVPEAQMVVCPASLDRRRRYVENWLKLREAWWYLIRQPNKRKAMMSRWWRAFLDDGFNFVAKVHTDHETARRNAVEVLIAAFNGQPFDFAELRPSWFGQVIHTADEALCRQIAWELSEMTFRLEVLVLDQTLKPRGGMSPAAAAEREQWIMQIFPGGGVLEIVEYPTESSGLASPDPVERSKSLDGLRRLMLDWPGCPESLKSSSPLDEIASGVLKTLEPIVKRFYVETFVGVANRPPTLPRERPAVPPPATPASSSPTECTPPLSPLPMDHTLLPPILPSQIMSVDDFSPPALTPRFIPGTPSPLGTPEPLPYE